MKQVLPHTVINAETGAITAQFAEQIDAINYRDMFCRGTSDVINTQRVDDYRRKINMAKYDRDVVTL